MNRLLIITSIFVQTTLSVAEEKVTHTFKRQQLSKTFYSEGATFGDINRDGKMDIVSGPYWYAGPDFWTKHAFYPPKSFDIQRYSDNFFAYTHDFNKDGWTDILVIGFPGKEAFWFENPHGNGRYWKKHLALPVVDNESPTFKDITGDGVPEIICHVKGMFGYGTFDKKEPTKPWSFHPVSPDRKVKRFTHGLGVGDINGDGKKDILEKNGWWENAAKKTPWRFHPYQFSKPGGAQMHAYDIDGDGDNDVVTSLWAHGYGLAWFEQVKQDGEISFIKHMIMGDKFKENSDIEIFSQLHAVALEDMDGDGIKDIITGKRFWAHGGHDPGGKKPVLSCWFKTIRTKNGVEFKQHFIDKQSGVGTQLVVGDINGDKLPDIVIGNKKGTFVLTHQVTKQPAKSISDKQIMHQGLPAKKAAEVMTLPKGFEAKVIAAEPDVKQPIALTIDDRGRLWVAEAYSYPLRKPVGKGKDRILIFEDTNGDGNYDSRKVFIDNLNLVSGIEVGHGGVWVGQAPYFLFIPDKNGDDIPDSKPQILLDGWGYHDTHETLNSFIWGPDGWLYGCHGVFTHSRVGKPGCKDEDRIPINAGIWRYHPTRHTFEVFAHGTSNPWGVDFNDHGQCFLTCCVIPHLFHIIQGGKYRRQAGNHFNPYVYDDIKTIAVHRHWAGKYLRDHTASAASGGGHAHAGAMIYLGDSWPEKYRNQIIMNNIHGARLNKDQLTKKGSGYVGNYTPDFLMANDIASQLLYFRYGPDGQMVMIDWYDMSQCHQQRELTDRTNGRIFKVIYNNAKQVKVDLTKLSDDELVKLQLHKNDWYVRHARRLLQERGGNEKVYQQLATMAFEHADETRRLRGLWALHVSGGLNEERIQKGLNNSSPYVRAWTIQLSLDNKKPTQQSLTKFAQLAKDDLSQVVRKYLAAGLQKLSHDNRWEILEALTKHQEDLNDHNLPLMYWYALEPMVPQNMQQAMEISKKSPIPLLLNFTTRRIADLGTKDAIAFLVTMLGAEKTTTGQLRFLKSINNSLKGRRQFPMPAPWKSVATKLEQSKDQSVKAATLALSVTFGDPQAWAITRRIVQNKNAILKQRKTALQSLIGAKDTELASTLHQLLKEKPMRQDALRGLAEYDDDQTGQLILQLYPQLNHVEKQTALSTMSSRVKYANQLLTSIANKKIPTTDLSAAAVTQMTNLNDKEVSAKIAKVWGQVKESPAELRQLIKHYKQLINKPRPRPDVLLGRVVFKKTCAACHKLFDDGGNIGPELTGSHRANLDYLLSNVIDPSAVMATVYQPLIIETIQGRVLTGLLKKETAQAITIQTAEALVVIPKNEIEERKQSTKSMMPDGLWKKLSSHEVRSLVKYLASRKQVPLKMGARK